MRPGASHGTSAELSQLGKIQRRVLGWYEKNRRALPWRETSDPYAILVSEVMLQQTQVERVIPKFLEFLELFPTIQSLAAAPLAQIIRRWAPLGYNRRAVRLHEIAREVAHKWNGSLPQAYEDLLRLPGIGPYTAAAVACFGFGAQRAAPDTNVRRVLARLFLGHSEATARQIAEATSRTLPSGRAETWNQALMDLGASLCSARKPRCSECPLAAWCLYRAQEEARALRPSEAAERPASYQAKAGFVGSNRFYRGRVIQLLRELEPGERVTLADLGARLRPDFGPHLADWLVGLAQELVEDGLVALTPCRGREDAVLSLP